MPRLNKHNLFATLPPVWPASLLPDIRRALSGTCSKLVVLDDDPTGTQTVHDIPVLTTWGTDELSAELANDLPAFYLLTNTRAFPADEAVRINRQIVTNLRQASTQLAVPRKFVLVSRSDSTLRGHFPAEVDTLAHVLAGAPSNPPQNRPSRPEAERGAGLPQDRRHLPPVLIIPYFEAGGRFTVGNIHYVAEGDDLVPAADTPFAKDPAFGYRNSDLCRWVEEKTKGQVRADKVAFISIDDLRRGGPDAVLAKLLSLNCGEVCVVNAAAPRDLEVLAWSSLQAEQAGRQFVYRTAASFVAARIAQEPGPLWEPTGNHEDAGGIVIIGSHVPKTTEQLEHLLAHTEVAGLELPVADLLGSGRVEVLRDAAVKTNGLLRAGHDVAVFTSRSLVTGVDPDACLAIAARVSSALVALTQALAQRPRFLIAKGGITSSDLASNALGVKRAMVLGQIVPGVPVWELGPETKFPGLPYVVFPGNVGGKDALSLAVCKFAQQTLKR